MISVIKEKAELKKESVFMKQPNILVLMADQMQGRVFDKNHLCKTPNIDKLISKGVLFKNAYSSNAVCSPARAGIMTGLLPHNHGVLTVTHCADKDQSCLRKDKPHWAERLSVHGYDTAYFGKWHVENTESPGNYGWRYDCSMYSEKYKEIALKQQGKIENKFLLQKNISSPGYSERMLYGVTDVAPEKRPMGIITSSALDYLEGAVKKNAPWCCFVSVPEPHDPFVCGKEAFELYNPDEISLPANFCDNMENQPGIYKKTAGIFKDISDKEKREAMACYYASITEIDQQFGRIIAFLEKDGAMENTIVIVISDHGELLGAHGLYCKNFSAYEEVYNIPMILCGPGIKENTVCDARVGSHDLCPTILELTGAERINNPDSRSFMGLLENPECSDDFQTGYAEYFGTRFYLTQRIVWHREWKYVFNGFDFDELYNLKDDPYEMNNLARNTEYTEYLRKMTEILWQKIKETGDNVLLNTQYAPFHFLTYGPGKIEN